jgi:predicted transcriptional regulator
MTEDQSTYSMLDHRSPQVNALRAVRRAVAEFDKTSLVTSDDVIAANKVLNDALLDAGWTWGAR